VWETWSFYYSVHLGIAGEEIDMAVDDRYGGGGGGRMDRTVVVTDTLSTAVMVVTASTEVMTITTVTDLVYLI
jgi:hypothetical protein